MRVQLEGQTLRLRVDEDELAQLLAGNVAENRTTLPDGHAHVQRVRLGDTLAWQSDGIVWHIDLPANDVRALSQRLPTRDGLPFAFHNASGQTLDVLFDVDVRDSTRRRFPKTSKGDVT